MVPAPEVAREWVDQLEPGVQVLLWTRRRGRTILEYSVVLRVWRDGGWRTLRVFDNAHGVNEVHRYTRSEGKQPGRVWHHGTAGEAFRDAWKSLKESYKRIEEAWLRS